MVVYWHKSKEPTHKSCDLWLNHTLVWLEAYSVTLWVTLTMRNINFHWYSQSTFPSTNLNWAKLEQWTLRKNSNTKKSKFIFVYNFLVLSITSCRATASQKEVLHIDCIKKVLHEEEEENYDFGGGGPGKWDAPLSSWCPVQSVYSSCAQLSFTQSTEEFKKLLCAVNTVC